MIRRRVGDEFWLITQDDHARLAAELARQVGNRNFDKLSEPAILGTELHDCGWPIHDDEPTLNPRGEPLDVFECPRDIALTVWQASADRAVARDVYAGLLTSLHVLSLSAFASSNATPQQAHEQFNINEAKTRFEVNRFQHKQIELQESLRRKLGLPFDLPMHLGLVEQSTDARELELQYHFRMLQAMDRLSLALSCTNVPNPQIKPVPGRPGAKGLTVHVTRSGQTDLKVSPWLFDSDELRGSVPFRRLPGKRSADTESFRKSYRAAPPETLDFRVFPG